MARRRRARRARAAAAELTRDPATSSLRNLWCVGWAVSAPRRRSTARSPCPRCGATSSRSAATRSSTGCASRRSRPRACLDGRVRPVGRPAAVPRGLPPQPHVRHGRGRQYAAAPTVGRWAVLAGRLVLGSMSAVSAATQAFVANRRRAGRPLQVSQRFARYHARAYRGRVAEQSAASPSPPSPPRAPGLSPPSHGTCRSTRRSSTRSRCAAPSSTSSSTRCRTTRAARGVGAPGLRARLRPLHVRRLLRVRRAARDRAPHRRALRGAAARCGARARARAPTARRCRGPRRLSATAAPLAPSAPLGRAGAALTLGGLLPWPRVFLDPWLRATGAWAIFVVNFRSNFSGYAYTYCLPLITARDYGFGQLSNSYVFGVIAGVRIGVTLLVSRLAKRYSDRGLMHARRSCSLALTLAHCACSRLSTARASPLAALVALFVGLFAPTRARRRRACTPSSSAAATRRCTSPCCSRTARSRALAGQLVGLAYGRLGPPRSGAR